MKYVDLYINTLHSDCTKKAYKDIITKMLSHIDKPIDEIAKIDLTEWVNTLQDLSTATQAQRIVAVKSFFRFLEDNDIITTNPSKHLKAPRINNKPKDSITKEEALEMLKWGTYRDRAIVAVYLSTGLRVQEVINLQLDDYMGDKGTLKVQTKGGKYRVVILNPDCQSYIDKYLSKERKDGVSNLFTSNQGTPMNKQSLNKTLQRLADKAGINKHVTNHTLRSTFVTDITKNHGIYAAQVAVGHSNISTTRRYVRGLETEVNDMLKEMSL